MIRKRSQWPTHFGPCFGSFPSVYFRSRDHIYYTRDWIFRRGILHSQKKCQFQLGQANLGQIRFFILYFLTANCPTVKVIEPYIQCPPLAWYPSGYLSLAMSQPFLISFSCRRFLKLLEVWGGFDVSVYIYIYIYIYVYIIYIYIDIYIYVC